MQGYGNAKCYGSHILSLTKVNAQSKGKLFKEEDSNFISHEVCYKKRKEGLFIDFTIDIPFPVSSVNRGGI